MPINYVNIENGVVGFSQKNYETKRHCHFYIEVAFSLTGYLNIKTDNYEYNNIKSVIINSNIPHTFDCLSGECQLYFFDPTSYIGNQLLKDYLEWHKDIVVNDLPSIDLFLKDYLSIYIYDEQKIALKDIDERINVCLEWIESNYSLEGVNVSMLAEVALLSNSRLAHLFKEQIGSSVHQYILWKKIEETIKLSQKGLSLTKCAHSSGFTDSSHFNRTFKNMFGITPYFVLKK